MDDIAGGYGYELDCWSVLEACRLELAESIGDDDAITVSLDLLHWLARPFGEYDRPC
jgi:hypothetical protein